MCVISVTFIMNLILGLIIKKPLMFLIMKQAFELNVAYVSFDSFKIIFDFLKRERKKISLQTKKSCWHAFSMLLDNQTGVSYKN